MCIASPIYCQLGWLLLGVALVAAPYSHAAEDVLLGQVASPSDKIPIEQINHSAWHSLLVRHVDERGRVNYRDWKQTSTDIELLDRYLDHLSTASLTPTPSQSAKLAFWINAYNAVTVKGILREYPTSSIRNHTPRFYGYHIWKNLKLRVDGNAYSLEQIEHEILRKMNEPRIHFAIVCASIGCPKLRNEAFVANRVDDQLARSAHDFFADPQKFRYNAEQQTFHVSPILEWFSEDFGRDQAALLRTMAPWLPDAQAKQLATNGAASVHYLDYDWNLNDQAQ